MSGFVGNTKWWILSKGHSEFHHLCQVLLKHETIGLNRVKENLLLSKKMRNRQHQTEIVDINDGYCFRFFEASEELIQPLTRMITAESDYSKLDFEFENSYIGLVYLLPRLLSLLVFTVIVFIKTTETPGSLETFDIKLYMIAVAVVTGDGSDAGVKNIPTGPYEEVDMSHG